MSTIYPTPNDYPKEIIGYARPWIASPGEQVDIKVSCTEDEYRYRTVRILQGYESDKGPPKVVEEIGRIPSGTGKGRFQLAHAGSHAVVPDLGIRPEHDYGLKASFYAQPWLVSCDHVQALLSTLNASHLSGISIVLAEDGVLQAWVGTGNKIEVVSTELIPEKRRWIRVEVEVMGRSLRLTVTALADGTAPAGRSLEHECTLERAIVLDSSTQLLLAASQTRASEDKESHHVPTNHYNGRLDSVVLEAVGQQPRLLAQYDFSKNMTSDSIVDISGNETTGDLVNAPSRAVKGYDWDGTETDWTKASYGYGAIHFHEDDLDDAGWSTDFSITIPQNARSGVYGVEIQGIGSEVSETVVFYVRPTTQSTSVLGAKVALVVSTFTYLAYANEHMFDPNSPARAEVPDEFGSFEFYKDETFYKQDRRKDLGLSLYDVHRDHSGVMFSSFKRPLLNNRPGYVNWTGHRPRELSAELIMVGYLERLEIPYDIVTDHDLHLQGGAALEAYTTVLTGCHPEYPTLESYSAYESYVKSGGNLMYLGGNGFYWSSALDSKRPHRLECRRGGQGVRTSYQEPGERHHLTDGKFGGLWRDRGKAANYLVGIGCCGEGAGPGVPYRMTPSLPQTHPELYSWLFAGLDTSSPENFLFGRNALGGFGGGASADEIDRVDFRYGSPSNVVIVASSTGHPDSFGLFPEDVGFPMMQTLGTQTNLIRSDMTLYETSGGGAVFSVGSISWYCALGWNDYDNDVAQVTGNVLRKFVGK